MLILIIIIGCQQFTFASFSLVCASVTCCLLQSMFMLSPCPPPSSLAAHTRENNERMKPVHRATSSPPSSPSRLLLAKTETRYICEHTRTHAMQLLPKAQHHCYQLGTDKQWQIEPLCLLWRVNKCELERSKMWPS